MMDVLLLFAGPGVALGVVLGCIIGLGNKNVLGGILGGVIGGGIGAMAGLMGWGAQGRVGVYEFGNMLAWSMGGGGLGAVLGAVLGARAGSHNGEFPPPRKNRPEL